MNKNYPNVELRVAFKTPNEIGKLFPFKDRIRSNLQQSNVIYRIKCQTCNADYIGKTVRILQYRVNEHKNPKLNSAIQKHLEENKDHIIDFDNVEILDRAMSDYQLRMKEKLHIESKNPILNKQLNCKFNSQIKTIIIGNN